MQLEARHSAGLLEIIVIDDGGGIDLERLREASSRASCRRPRPLAQLSEAELLRFLFLPGFTMATRSPRCPAAASASTRCRTWSSRCAARVRAGPARRAGHALPAAAAADAVGGAQPAGGDRRRAVRLSAGLHRPQLKRARRRDRAARRPPAFRLRGPAGRAGHRHVRCSTRPASQHGDDVLGGGRRRPARTSMAWSSIAFSASASWWCSRSIRASARSRTSAAGALMEDGSPVLIVDVEDMIRSMDKLLPPGAWNASIGAAPGRRTGAQARAGGGRFADRARAGAQAARSRGYEVEVAVDGMDGWNAVRTGHFDLVVTDIDMPRMDGIELVTLITSDSRLQVAAGDDRVVQGPRGGPPARPRGRRRLLPDQGQLPRRDAAATRWSI